jgi:hypothetical protein
MSGLDIHTTKDFEDLGSFSVIELLKLCEDQNSLLRDNDILIKRFAKQLSEYEQELYEKDVYIKELEHLLEVSNYKEDLI